MALALPVVATRIGGTVEALGRTIPFWSAGTPMLWPRLIARLRATTPRRQVQSERRNPRTRFEAVHAPTRMAQETAELYRRADRGQAQHESNEGRHAA